MKKMLWLLLAAMPMQAVANDEDPIAYKCYYCTPDEMEEVALAQGVGRHYVYDAQNLSIFGYNVVRTGQLLVAESFAAEDWVESQFLGMMALYSGYSGDMKASIQDVRLLAPGTEHGRRHSYLWGHHLSSLNPHHATAREYVHRFLATLPRLQFLNTSTSSGKLLRFEYMLDDARPILAELSFFSRDDGRANFNFDHDARRWVYQNAESYSFQGNIQEKRDDFAPIEGEKWFHFSRSQRELAEAFIERALWAHIPVHGTLPDTGDLRFVCRRAGDDIQCYVD